MSRNCPDFFTKKRPPAHRGRLQPSTLDHLALPQAEQETDVLPPAPAQGRRAFGRRRPVATLRLFRRREQHDNMAVPPPRLARELDPSNSPRHRRCRAKFVDGLLITGNGPDPCGLKQPHPEARLPIIDRIEGVLKDNPEDLVRRGSFADSLRNARRVRASCPCGAPESSRALKPGGQLAEAAANTGALTKPVASQVDRYPQWARRPRTERCTKASGLHANPGGPGPARGWEKHNKWLASGARAAAPRGGGATLGRWPPAQALCRTVHRTPGTNTARQSRCVGSQGTQACGGQICRQG